MVQVYHNTRCSKSRAAIEYLQQQKIAFEVIEYLKEPLTVEELTNLINKLEIEPIQLVRKNESIWKENFKNKELTNSQIIEAMVTYPKLIERPIIVNNDKAVVARPTDKIEQVL